MSKNINPMESGLQMSDQEPSYKKKEPLSWTPAEITQAFLDKNKNFTYEQMAQKREWFLNHVSPEEIPLVLEANPNATPKEVWHALVDESKQYKFKLYELDKLTFPEGYFEATVEYRRRQL